jgi:hypothetical protein
MAVTRESPSGLSRLRLTVAELLAESRFQLRLVAGGSGLDRPIRWAHSTELLNPGPYLRGHEIVLTVGASFREPALAVAFAESVHASTASAIGYGIGDVTPEVPEALREACERLGLPLFEVPPDVPFVSFTEWLAERLAIAHDVEHDRQEVGRLLGLVGSGLASAEAVRGHVERAGLTDRPLVVAALPVPEVPTGTETPPGVLLGVADGVAVLLAADELPARELAASWLVPCGIGGPVPLAQLSRGLSESRAALDLARRRGGIVRSGDLATFTALLGGIGPHRLEPFIEQIARPLAAYDAAHGTRLIDTLQAFLESDGSVGTASRALFLHVNSLRHRLARIEAVTGRNPLRFEDRIALAVAMWAWSAQN